MTWWQHWIVGQVDASMTAIVLLAIATLGRHRLPPSIRSVILLIALARLALPPWLRSPWSEAAADIPPIDDSRMMLADLVRLDGAEVLATLTTIVTVMLVARLGWCALTATARWRRSTVPAPAALQQRVDHLIQQAGINGAIDVRIAATDGPLATGILSRLIVLPGIAELKFRATGLTASDDRAIDAVLAHETAHHVRHDLLWIAMARVLSAIVWFNPLAHLITRAIVSAREDGSDDWAISHTSRDPFEYAHELLRSARMAVTSTDGGWLGDPLASGAHPMGKRLTRLLSGEARADRALSPLAIALLLIVGAASMPGAHMPDPSSGDESYRIVITQVIKQNVATRTRYQIP